MLRNFTLSNWKSYADAMTMTMTATREQRFSETLSRVQRSRLLPISVLFGANASGKSALVTALAALQTTVVAARDDGELLPMQPNLTAGNNEPCSFELEFVVSWEELGHQKDAVYVYELEADRKRIYREVLALVRSHDERIIFEREKNEVTLYQDLENNEVAKAMALIIDEKNSFLGRLGSRNDSSTAVKRAYDWFAHNLLVIQPDDRYRSVAPILMRDGEFARHLNRAISETDSGISSIYLEPTSTQRLPLSEEQLDDLKRDLRANSPDTVKLVVLGKEQYTVELDEDEETLLVKILMSRHQTESGKTGDFSLTFGHESDGTRRYLNLLPMITVLSDPQAKIVCIIDELETSLHPLLTKRLIEDFLVTTDSHSRRQLIFTSHEATLLRRTPLRRDEVWLVGKNTQGYSSLDRLSTFRDAGVRDGSAVLEMYMSGQLGAVPQE